MIWEIEYYERKGKLGHDLWFMNKDKKMVWLCGGGFLPWSIVRSALLFRRWEG